MALGKNHFKVKINCFIGKMKFLFKFEKSRAVSCKPGYELIYVEGQEISDQTSEFELRISPNIIFQINKKCVILIE